MAKALGAGADFVMVGGMFAGHEQSGGELIVKENGQKYKSFYGMSSNTAMEKYAGGVAEYRSVALLRIPVINGSVSVKSSIFSFQKIVHPSLLCYTSDLLIDLIIFIVISFNVPLNNSPNYR